MTFRHLRNARGFFSDYYLGSVFGRGSGRGRRRKLSDRETDLAYARFRRIRERAEGRAAEPAECRERFARPLLRDVLGLHLGAGEDRLHGLFASADAEASGQPPILVCYSGAWDEDLDAGRGPAQPARRLEAALARLGLRHGLLVTGERLRLVRAAGDGPRGAHLEVDLASLAEDDDPESFAAFHRLLSAPSFLPDAEGKTPIEEVERESRRHAEKVSDDLKQAVFGAAESLVAGLIQDALARGRIASARDLAEADFRVHRDAALLGIYRILFILYAEARDPRLDEHRLYRESYSAQGLLDEVLRDPGRPWPENRCTLWQRLRALFRIYDGGLPPITPWQNIPPRGGDFFSAETPQGKLLDEARLPDRAVASLMLDLATTAPRRGVGRERVSFRELDIENLGAVYEGLLEHEPRVARETTLEIRVQGRAYALAPHDVIRLCEQKSLTLRGDFALVEGTAAASLHPEAPGEDAEEEETADEEPEDEPQEAAEAGAGTGEDGGEDEGVKKGATARLVRRLEPGDFHFVPGPGRKGSGSFYTPRLLVQDLVRHALGPLVEGRTAAGIERLRVLDPACGSAHFLVEAMRFLGQALHRALVQEHGGKAPSEFRSTTRQGWDDHWRASDEEARAANSEARAWCKRRIAERCLFGVDLNPTAVQLARVALWIESVAGDRPLTYFEHHVRCGNSLLGSWMERLRVPPLPALSRQASAAQPGLFEKLVRDAVAEAARVRRLIDDAAPEDLRREGIEPDTVEEQGFKERQRRRAEDLLAAAKLLFDLRSASAFVPEIWAEWNTLCGLIDSREDLRRYAAGRPWWETFERVGEREKFFHWELEFSEVFLETEKPGFDAVLGNPPWDKVLPARKDFYARYDVLIRAFTGNELDRRIRELQAVHPGLADEFKAYSSRTKVVASILRKSRDFVHSQARSGSAHEDVSKYFLDRAARLIGEGGAVGMVAPSVVYNGDGCVGLRWFFLREAAIERFYGFENRRKVFPIHSSYKFVSLVFRKGALGADSFQAAFMRHDLEELEATARRREPGHENVAPGPAPWVVTMRRDEIERLSPDTSAFLEYRGPRDQEIVRRMHEGRPTLGASGARSWEARLVSWRAHEVIYNSSEDKDLWTDPRSGRLYSPGHVLGRLPSEFEETLELMRERGFWPVFEGKHIELFVVGIKPIRWWLSVEHAERKYGRPPRAEPTLVFRETASNTNERTCIAAVLPPRSAAGHTLTGVLVEAVDPQAASTVLNSLAFDWALRLRTAGTHVSFTYIQPMPVPRPDVTNALPGISTRLAWESAIQHVTEDHDLWPDLWAAHRAVAEAYGLGPADFEHILSAFPVFARKRPAFYFYLRERVTEWISERKGSGARREVYPASRREAGLRVAEGESDSRGDR